MLELLDRSSVAACLLTLCTIAGLYLWRNRTAKYAGIPLPPGPPRLPLVGNLLQMPKSHDWLTYEAWAKEFGKFALCFGPRFFSHSDMFALIRFGCASCRCPRSPYCGLEFHQSCHGAVRTSPLDLFRQVQRFEPLPSLYTQY